MKETPAQRPLRVILADDHSLIRSGMAALLREVPGVEVIAEAADGEELLRVAMALEPDVVLADIDMPRMNGLEAIRQLRKSRPSIRCVVVSMSEDAQMMRDAAAAGAAGYMMKTAQAQELGLALRTVMERGAYFSPAVATKLLAPHESRPHDLLTARQFEILQLLAQGAAAKEIAHDLNLSTKTVEQHRMKIMERLQVSDLANLTRYAIRHGLLKA